MLCRLCALPSRAVSHDIALHQRTFVGLVRDILRKKLCGGKSSCGTQYAGQDKRSIVFANSNVYRNVNSCMQTCAMWI